MPTPNSTLIDLEKKFWQSLIDQDAEAATRMLSEPSLMVSTHGTMKFDHAAYRKMAIQGPMVIKSFELSDIDVMFPNEKTAIVTYRVKQSLAPRGKNESTTQEMNDSSTWIQDGKRWQCVMHTETPAEGQSPKH